MAEARCELAAGARIGGLDAAALAAAVRALAARLPAPTPGSQVAFAFDRDRAAFAVALLATWRRGHAVALPASPRRRHVGPVLLRPETAVLLHDTGAGLGIDVGRFLAERHDGGGGAPVALTGPLLVFAPDGTPRAVDAGALAQQVARAAAELPPGTATRVANLCAPALPGALVPGLLAPLAAGAAITDDPAGAAVVVAPRDRTEGTAVAGARMVAIDAEPEPPPPPIDRRPLVFAPVARQGDETARYRVTVPADFFGFAGHFPGYPVLSGAVQLHELVLPCLRAALGDAAAPVAAFTDLKFLARIAPGDTVDVTLRSAQGRCDFTIARGGTRCSTGRAVLAAAEAP